jgi:hypothetical protein
MGNIITCKKNEYVKYKKEFFYQMDLINDVIRIMQFYNGLYKSPSINENIEFKTYSQETINYFKENKILIQYFEFEHLDKPIESLYDFSLFLNKLNRFYNISKNKQKLLENVFFISHIALKYIVDETLDNSDDFVFLNDNEIVY